MTNIYVVEQIKHFSKEVTTTLQGCFYNVSIYNVIVSCPTPNFIDSNKCWIQWDAKSSVHWCFTGHYFTLIFQRKFVWLFVEVACLNTSTFTSAIEYSPESQLEKSMQIPRAIKCEVDSPKQKKSSFAFVRRNHP